MFLPEAATGVTRIISSPLVLMVLVFQLSAPYLEDIHMQSLRVVPSQKSVVIVNLRAFGPEVTRDKGAHFVRSSAT